MNSKRILSLVMAMVLAVSLCLPGTTAYAIEPEDDDLESEQVIPTEPALCSYTSNENDRHADNVTLSEAVGVLNENGGGTITVTRSGLASNGSSAILNLEVEQDITIVAEENRPVTVTLTEPMFMMDCQGNADGKLTLGQEGMTSGLLTFDGVQEALCFARSNWRNTKPFTRTRKVEINDGIVMKNFAFSVMGMQGFAGLDVTMHGGEILENTPEASWSLGAYTYSSTIVTCMNFYMDGGSIHDNTANDSIINVIIDTGFEDVQPVKICGDAKIYKNSHDPEGTTKMSSVVSASHDVILSDDAKIYGCEGTADLVSCYSNDITMKDNASVYDCTSTGQSQGLSAIHGVNVTMEDNAAVYNCTSEIAGAVSGNRSVTMSGNAAIRNCKTLVADKDYPANGVAVYAGISPYVKDNEVSFHMQDNAVISNCSGPAAAGGVYVKNGKAWMSDQAKIEYCSTPQLSDYAHIYIDSQYMAGGVYILGGSLTMSGQSNIDHCSTYGSAGGVYMAYASSEIVMEDQASITNCTNLNTTVDTEGTDNYRVGGLSAEKTTVTIGQNAKITGCKGIIGGIGCKTGFLDTKGTSSVSIAGEVSGNTGVVGGGVCGLRSVQLTLENTAVIKNNTATIAGGGIALLSYAGEVAPASELTLNGASIIGNNAPLGGGVFVAGKADIPEAPVFYSSAYAEKASISSVTITGGTITGNTAGNPDGGAASEFHGGGLFLGWNTKTNISGAVNISGNVDADGLPNNMYLRKDPDFVVETPAPAPAEGAELDELQEYLTSALKEYADTLVKTDIVDRMDPDNMLESLQMLELASADEKLTDDEIAERFTKFYSGLYAVPTTNNLPGIITKYKNDSVFTPTYEEFGTVCAKLITDNNLDSWGRMLYLEKEEQRDQYAERFGLIESGGTYTGTITGFAEAFVRYSKTDLSVLQSFCAECEMTLVLGIDEETYAELWSVEPVTSVLSEGDARVSISAPLTGSRIGVITEGAQYGRVVSVGISNYALTDDDLSAFTSDDPAYDVVRHPSKANQFILKPRTVEPAIYTITAEAETGGSIHPDGAVSVAAGGDQAFVITPDNDYHIADVLVDGVSVGAVNHYEFTDVQSNHHIKATFAKDNNNSNNSGGGGSSSGTYHYVLHYESNGGTSYKDESCSDGTTVKLEKTPIREGYTFTGWYADKNLTEKISSVKMNGNKTVYAGWRATNVPAMLNGDDHYAYVIGYSDGNVRPNANVSRAETATIFFRLLNADIRDGNLTAENTFTDVVDGQWCNKSVSTMAKLGIVKGRTAEIFDPNAPITRAEFAVICARFDTKQTNGNNNFSDISGHWAEAEIKRAAALGWIAGYPDGTFRPNDYITRAQAMTMINRVLCRMPQDEEDLLGSMVVWPDNKPTDWHYLAVQEATNSHDFKRKGEVGEKWTKLTSAPDWTKYQ